MDVVFGICNLVCAEVPAAVVATGQILADYTYTTWGEVHPALREHDQQEFVQKAFSCKAIAGLSVLRKVYITEACLHALSGRLEVADDQLRRWVKDSDIVLAKMDNLCGIAECDTLSAGYGVSFMQIVKNGSVALSDIADVAQQPGASGGASSASAPQNKVDTQLSKSARSGAADDCSRLISQKQLSKLDVPATNDGDSQGIGDLLKSTEAMHDLRLSLASDMMTTARSV